MFSASSSHCEALPAGSHYSRTEPPTLSPPQKEQRGRGCLSCWALRLASAEKSLSFQVTACLTAGRAWPLVIDLIAPTIAITTLC